VLGEKQDWLKGNKYNFTDPGVVMWISSASADPAADQLRPRDSSSSTARRHLRDGPGGGLQKAKPETPLLKMTQPVSRHHRRCEQQLHFRPSSTLRRRSWCEFIARGPLRGRKIRPARGSPAGASA
jgi:hypothetical protein